MYKSLVAGAAIALGTVGWRGAVDAGPALGLKEERVFIEYTPAVDEAVLVVEAESETGLDRVEVKSASADPVFRLRAQDRPGLGLFGIEIESGEADLASLLATYAEGDYFFRARNVLGQSVLGSAVLSHVLLAEPVVLYPVEGLVTVPTTGLVVSWVNDPAAVGYVVVLEQDENDGLKVHLPAGSDSFHVPDHFLTSGSRALAEVAAVAANGNRTMVEVGFQTL